MGKKKSQKRQDHELLRKGFAGLLLTCFIVFVIGQSVMGVSANSTLIWSSVLILVIGVAGQIVIKLWRSWEEIHDDSMKPQKK